jgi:DNA-binding transcriptional LysR family regulator
VTGRLRVNAPLSFALSTLAPLLARFHAAPSAIADRPIHGRPAGGRRGPGL